MSVMFETLEGRQLFSVSLPTGMMPAHVTGAAVHAEPANSIRSGYFIGSASHSDGRVAVKLEMKLDRLKKGGANVLIRITDNQLGVDVIRMTIDSTGAFNYTMHEETKTRVLTGGLSSDGNVFSGNWVETDNVSGEQTTGTFRLVRMTAQTKTRNYRGAVNTSHGVERLSIRLTHLDSGYLAEARVVGKDGIEIVYFNVAEDGSFSFDKNDDDGGMTHVEGAFTGNLKKMSGQWSSTHDDTTTESGTFGAMLV